MAWVINYPEHVFRETDLTIGECERIEMETGKNWRVLHPLNSASQAKGILVVLLQSRCGKSLEEARTEVDALKANDFTDMLGIEDLNADLPAVFENGFPPVAVDPSTGS